MLMQTSIHLGLTRLVERLLKYRRYDTATAANEKTFMSIDNFVSFFPYGADFD